MCADVVGAVDVDGPYLEPGRLEVAEGALDAGEGLVGVDGLVGGDVGGGEAGADDVDAVEPGLGGDAGFVAGPGEVVVDDGDGEVLLDLAAVGLAPEAVADPVPAAQLRV